MADRIRDFTPLYEGEQVHLASPASAAGLSPRSASREELLAAGIPEALVDAFITAINRHPR